MSNETIRLYEELTTRQKIDGALTRINNHWAANRHGRPMTLDKHAGGYRLFSTRGREISPRLPAKEMLLWLEGFEAGLDARG